MKIVHLTGFFMPTMGYQERYLALHHVEMGHQVWVLTSALRHPLGEYQWLGSDGQERRMTPGLRTDELPGVQVIRLEAKVELRQRVWLVGLERALREIDPDMIVAHGMNNFNTLRVVLMRLSARLKPSCTIVTDDHMLFSAGGKGAARSMFYFLIAKAWMPLMRRARVQFVAVSDETKLFVEKFYGLRPAEVLVIPLGVDVETFQRDEARGQDLRRQLGIPADARVIIQTGKIIANKGQQILLEAALPLLAQDSKVWVVFVGTGDPQYIQSLQLMASGKGVQERVRFIPPVHHDALPAYYSAADIAVWPLQESMSVQDASACQLPVIMRNSHVGRERTSHGRGRTYSSPAELTEALGWLVRDASARKEMGMRGREFIERELSWRQLARRFLDLRKREPRVVGNALPPTAQ
jgi:glycosyltransferase involved in cell wall biosynthesis